MNLNLKSRNGNGNGNETETQTLKNKNIAKNENNRSGGIPIREKFWRKFEGFQVFRMFSGDFLCQLNRII